MNECTTLKSIIKKLLLYLQQIDTNESIIHLIDLTTQEYHISLQKSITMLHVDLQNHKKYIIICFLFYVLLLPNIITNLNYKNMLIHI